MSLSSALRQPTVLLRKASPFLARTTATTYASQVRHAHSVPSIGEFDGQFTAEGVPELMSKEAYRLAWFDYQQHLVDRLNNIIARNPSSIAANTDVKTLLLNSARDPKLAALFNLASGAHNNHFFFQCLSPTETAIPKDLETHLINSFGSIESLRKALLTQAAAMFGPGFVWLVQHNNPPSTVPSVAATNSSASGMDFSSGGKPGALHFRILTTYLAGSPYPGAHTRQQERDMNTENLVSAEDFRRQSVTQNTSGSFGKYSTPADMGSVGLSADSATEKYGGAQITPVLCVNTWEHVWMFDYGVAGKRTYLERWWKTINWEQVWRNCNVRSAGPRGRGPFRMR